MNSIYRLSTRIVVFVASLVIVGWFLSQVVGLFLLLLLAMVLVLIINHPVKLLVRRNLSRPIACLIVFGSIFIIIGGIVWLTGPIISSQFSSLLEDLPKYIENVSAKINRWANEKAGIKDVVSSEDKWQDWLPSFRETFQRIGSFSINVLSGIVLIIIFISIVIYGVLNPAPLIRVYLSFYPQRSRPAAISALRNTTTMLLGWIRANLIAGSMEAVLVGGFLQIMQVPGALVWAALAFFSELVPKIGFYLMSIPPVIVALSLSGTTAIWVIIFFLALNEIMGDLVIPKLRSATMNIHPVFTLIMVLLIGSTFGLIGALIATPLCAIIKAHYEAFYYDRLQGRDELEKDASHIVKANS